MEHDRLQPGIADQYATHPAAQIRQAAVVRWRQHTNPDPELVAGFLADSDPDVRAGLAYALVRLGPDGVVVDYQASLEVLRSDRSARVRRCAAGLGDREH